jgi:hypothetical protein
MTFDDSCIAITVTTCEPGWTSKCYWKQSSKPSLDITREPRLVFVADIFFKTPYIDIHWQSVVVSTFLKLHRGHCLLCYPVVSCGCRAFLSHSPLPEGKREMYRERLRIPKQWQPWRTTGLLWSTWVWRDRSKRTSDHCNCLYIIIISIYIIYIYIIICLLLYVYIYTNNHAFHTLCASLLSQSFRSGVCRRSIRPTPRFDNPRPQNICQHQAPSPREMSSGISNIAMGNARFHWVFDRKTNEDYL